MTKKEQLLMAITMLDESDCEYVLKILSGETRKDFEKDKIKFKSLSKEEVEQDRSSAYDYLL